MRNPETPKGASFINPATKPVDVKYRVEGFGKAVSDGEKYIRALDPNLFPQAHAKALGLLADLAAIHGEMEAARPRVRTEVSPEEKQAAKAEAARLAEIEKLIQQQKDDV